jgi:hypothetical protein
MKILTDRVWQEVQGALARLRVYDDARGKVEPKPFEAVVPREDQLRVQGSRRVKLPQLLQDKVTRFEVIDHRTGLPQGRTIVATPCKIELSYQDQGRTLKVFVKDPE